jgi:hypothetical protein
MLLIHTIAGGFVVGLGVGLGRRVRSAALPPQTTSLFWTPDAPAKPCRSPFVAPAPRILICALCRSDLRPIPDYGPDYTPDTDGLAKFYAAFSVS